MVYKKSKEGSSIVEFLLEHRSRKPISFHMPGHKGSGIYKKYGYEEFLKNIMECDITEIPGADNLFQPEECIRKVMESYKALYKVRKSYLLINGTSCGLISAILASSEQGGKLIMARNCHKSVFNGLALGNLSPVYVYPKLVEQFGISGEIEAEDIERALKENPDAEAVILPSPNYYGICSDIQKISEVVHRYGRLLIVDQAHGAHLKLFSRFSDVQSDKSLTLPKPAEECGADIVINSIHKTLASFTQSAVMNVVSDKVDLQLLEDRLQQVESTSPSYLLMSSLEINAEIIKKYGCELIEQWQDSLMEFYKNAESILGLQIVNTGSNMDWTKINLDMSECGLSGNELELALMEKNIYPELVTGNIVMCMSGIGNSRQDYRQLEVALQDISNAFLEKADFCKMKKKDYSRLMAGLSENQQQHCHIPSKKTGIALDEAVGHICAASLIPYPPGIPLVCPGERITEEIVECVKALRKSGEKVIGIDENGKILVGR